MAKVAALLLLAACGDPLVDAGFRGGIKSTVAVNANWGGQGAAPAPGNLRAAFFYAPNLTSVDPEEWIEDSGTATPIAQLPGPLVINIFSLPTTSMLVGGTGYGVARLLAYDDQNRDGRREKGEPFAGIQPPNLWIYSAADLGAGASPTSHALAAGLTAVYVPQNCPGPPPPPTVPGDCGAHLGERCDFDSDCSPGLCLKETKFPWPAGYCMVPEPPLTGCRPGTSVLVGRPRYSLVPGSIRGLYLRPCGADADCTRSGDRDQGGYVCEPGYHACVPRGSSQSPLQIGSRFEVEPFCAQSGPPPPPP